MNMQVEELDGLSGLNFFTVDRSLLTSVLGSVLTYLIILRDVKQS